LFLLVPTGRARGLKDKQIKSEEYERLLLWLCRKKEDFPLHIKPTCAPQYYRILRQQKTETGTKKHGLDMLTKGCLGGISFCFISAEEIVQPCGYLELNCGDLKRNSFSDIWNNSDVFKRLRDFSLYKALLVSKRKWVLLKHSFALSTLTTLFSTIIGVPLGILFTKTDLPFRRAFALLFIIPLLVPPYITAISWFDLLGRDGLLSHILGLSVTHITSKWLFDLPG